MTLDHIKYITFSQLMSSVESDMDSFADSGMIDRSKYIKTVRKVNSDLGIRINKEKEKVLPIKNYKVQLPDDFEYLQLALLCKENPTSYNISDSVDPSKLVPVVTSCNIPTGCSQCPKPSCSDGGSVNLCGNCYKIYEYQPQDLTIVYDTQCPIKLTKRSHNYCSDSCLNLLCTSDKYKYTVDLDDRVMTISGVKEGYVYVNYLTDMVNDDNEILIVDHPLVNDFYEYSVKEKMLENFLLNSDADVANKLKYVIDQKQLARVDAMNFVYMPEYTEIVSYQNAKRQNFYNRYFKAFERY